MEDVVILALKSFCDDAGSKCFFCSIIIFEFFSTGR
jgi:hypothetical protein